MIIHVKLPLNLKLYIYINYHCGCLLFLNRKHSFAPPVPWSNFLWLLKLPMFRPVETLMELLVQNQLMLIQLRNRSGTALIRTIPTGILILLRVYSSRVIFFHLRQRWLTLQPADWSRTTLWLINIYWILHWLLCQHFRMSFRRKFSITFVFNFLPNNIISDSGLICHDLQIHIDFLSIVTRTRLTILWTKGYIVVMTNGCEDDSFEYAGNCRESLPVWWIQLVSYC